MTKIEKKERVLTSENMRFPINIVCDEYLLLLTTKNINVSQELYDKLVTYIKETWDVKTVIEELDKTVTIKEPTKENTDGKLKIKYRNIKYII